MGHTLRSLRHGASALAASEGFRSGVEPADFAPYEAAVARPDDIDITEVRIVLDHARKKFADNPKESDAWVAPRLHAALRISRRTAADRGVWRWLAMVCAPDFVRWRWGDPDKGVIPGLERFDGDDKKQTFARLWWTAELCRNGRDYEPAVNAFKYQEFVNSCVGATVLSHHRPAVQALLQAVLAAPKGFPAGGDAVRALTPALNSAATTRLLDAIGPDVEWLDTTARERWRGAAADYDATAYFEQLPDGPDDQPVPEESVAAIRTLIEDLRQDSASRVIGRRTRRRVQAEDTDSADDLT